MFTFGLIIILLGNHVEEYFAQSMNAHLGGGTKIWVIYSPQNFFYAIDEMKKQSLPPQFLGKLLTIAAGFFLYEFMKKTR